MLIQTQDFHWRVELSGDPSAPPLVMLHGFAQTLSSFDLLLPFLEERLRIIRVDLPGHGETVVDSHVSLGWSTLTSNLLEVIAQVEPRPAHWFGYSQGGRVALMCALSKPAQFASLALLGASTGIANPDERKHRRESDLLLAQNILRRGMTWFTSYWETLPIFATQKSLPPHIQDHIRRERLKCSPEGLALALKYFGTGTMPDCFNDLAGWEKPLFLAAGEIDSKFVESNANISRVSCARLLRRHTLPGCGHAAHIEQPQQFVNLLVEFISAAEGSST
ncbi:alpha/beta fold hydrolase [bacterium]|nr:alpha/beta fold hydrolase [bacterium]